MLYHRAINSSKSGLAHVRQKANPIVVATSANPGPAAFLTSVFVLLFQCRVCWFSFLVGYLRGKNVMGDGQLSFSCGQEKLFLPCFERIDRMKWINLFQDISLWFWQIYSFRDFMFLNNDLLVKHVINSKLCYLMWIGTRDLKKSWKKITLEDKKLLLLFIHLFQILINYQIYYWNSKLQTELN